MNQKQLDKIPAFPKRQDSVSDQMADLKMVANRLGMHDAADAINQLMPKLPELKYGCHCDIYDGEEPDGCVIDTGEFGNCTLAERGGRKEQCEQWRIV